MEVFSDLCLYLLRRLFLERLNIRCVESKEANHLKQDGDPSDTLSPEGFILDIMIADPEDTPTQLSMVCLRI